MGGLRCMCISNPQVFFKFKNLYFIVLTNLLYNYGHNQGHQKGPRCITSNSPRNGNRGGGTDNDNARQAIVTHLGGPPVNHEQAEGEQSTELDKRMYQ